MWIASRMLFSDRSWNLGENFQMAPIHLHSWRRREFVTCYVNGSFIHSLVAQWGCIRNRVVSGVLDVISDQFLCKPDHCKPSIGDWGEVGLLVDLCDGIFAHCKSCLSLMRGLDHQKSLPNRIRICHLWPTNEANDSRKLLANATLLTETLRFVSLCRLTNGGALFQVSSLFQYKISRVCIAFQLLRKHTWSLFVIVLLLFLRCDGCRIYVPAALLSMTVWFSADLSIWS